VLKAVVGKKHFTDSDQAAWWQRLEDLRSHKCFNKDINSLQLYQGQQLWVDGKAAMTITAGSDVKKFILQGGVKRVGVMAMPRWAKGPYAGKLGSTSQTLGITGWTKNPQAAADFIKFTHTPGRLASFFKTTGAFPADDRFNTKLIKLAQQKVLFNMVKHGAPYLENFIPTELDTKANFAQAQLLMAGNINAKQAAEATERIDKRIRLTQRDLINNFFAKWAEQFK
jgi:multiple sugar transport system substrate-binding protein